MENLSFKANPAQMVAVTKVPLKEKKTIQQGFQQHFETAVESDSKITLSKHAKWRMDQRKIEINSQTWDQIADKAKEAKKKGVTESLVITSNVALVISTKNNRVITVMDREEASSQIFTNINGTIILE
ncbi:TIGR02530 family flagellar biosynthesis protein [Peribacillus sp. NPDC097225]|uniref:TIGR02530 family flagellar biosynthesis protein n=1 Tax=Peribacillus sp. NPDC097225 TaxID=3364400 RepID=UPI00381973E9